MTRIKLTLWSLFGVLTGLYLLADQTLLAPFEFFPVRNALVMLTGILAIAAMSAALLLALRPAFAEGALGGLDKMYRLHKWLGIAALVLSIVHWLAAKGPKWLVGAGLLDRPVRSPRPEITDPIQRLFQQQRGLAEGLGEWAFYATALLLVLALVKWFPYRWFFKTHRLLAVAFLVLAYHGAILMKFDVWPTPLGFAMVAILISGVVAALVALYRSMGFAARTAGVVDSVVRHDDNRVLQVGVTLKGRWRGHDAGQFAFVTFDRSEGPHPFTIASSWHGDGKLMFLIKELGDYTHDLPATLKAGDPVEIEGPYGRFDFETEKPRQIWIAGGIGISPFVARMQALRDGAPKSPVDLFFSSAAPNQNFLPDLRALAESAGVTLHFLASPRDGMLSAADVMSAVPQWHEADIWFCGPATFGEQLRHDLSAAGLSASAFHQEFFEMR